MAMVFGHEVAIVLSGPGWRAGSLTRYHDYCRSGGHMTDSTGNIVILAPLKRVFILSSINRCYCICWSTSAVGKGIFWNFRHAEMICSSSRMSVVRSSSETRIDILCPSYFWASAFPPSCISSSSTLRSSRSLLSLWSRRSWRTSHSISTWKTISPSQ